MALGTSIRTAEPYRGRIMSKLHLHLVVDLVRYAIRNGIVQRGQSACFGYLYLLTLFQGNLFC